MTRVEGGEEIGLSSEDELYAALFDPMACKVTAPSHIGSYTSCPISYVL